MKPFDTNHPHYSPDVAQIMLFEGRLPADDPLWDVWNAIKVHLDEGIYTRAELVELTGYSSTRIRPLLHYGQVAHVVQIEDLRREVEVAPGVWMLKPVRGYRSRRPPMTNNRKGPQ